ncbi:hypothetical protein TRIUR3_27818 [Triticum urartu]|uniref:Uncharacterized protein n=1 Tax=Triticum urartu TaxID=4572 RepID=M7ZBK0_TRIUA|nr:hypothetical protein TRIUR3_27818 [Triticum urartu]
MEEAATGAGEPWVAERRKGGTLSCISRKAILLVARAMQAATSASECRSLAAGALVPVVQEPGSGSVGARTTVSQVKTWECIWNPGLSWLFIVRLATWGGMPYPEKEEVRTRLRQEGYCMAKSVLLLVLQVFAEEAEGYMILVYLLGYSWRVEQKLAFGTCYLKMLQAYPSPFWILMTDKMASGLIQLQNKEYMECFSDKWKTMQYNTNPELRFCIELEFFSVITVSKNADDYTRSKACHGATSVAPLLPKGKVKEGACVVLLQLAARIAVSNLHKNAKKSFSEMIKDMYLHYNERSRPLLCGFQT